MEIALLYEGTGVENELEGTDCGGENWACRGGSGSCTIIALKTIQ